LFPFGHGLSYTSFRFARLKATARALSVDVTNTGNRAGAEVVQVYVTHPAGSGEPPDQLEAFRRVVLRPHQTARVHLRLTRRAFASWDADTGRWTVPAGRYRVRVGDSSRQLPLSAPVRIG
jgi:beta-glucosidase